MALDVDDPAEDISGTDILTSNRNEITMGNLTGDRFTLSDYAGKVVVLATVEYWNWPSCGRILSIMQNLWEKYQGHGVQMVGMHTSISPNYYGAVGAAYDWLTDPAYICDKITFPVIQPDQSTYNKTYYDYVPEDTRDYPPNLWIINRNQVICHYSNLYDPTLPDPALKDSIEDSILECLYVREPVDLELVMDVSGSMRSSSTGGDSKLVLMKQASKMLIDFLYWNGKAEDRVGLVWFTDNASEYERQGQKLFPVKNNVANLTDLKNQIDTLGMGNCTAMGAGLQTAFSTLEPSTNKRYMILLTDGMQNIEPKLARLNDHCEIIDGSDRNICGAHSNVAARPGVDIASYNTGVHTIGVGITATYESLLQDLSNETDGQFLATNQPSADLDLIYFVDLCNCLAGSSPAIVHHHAGTFSPNECQAIETFKLNQSVRKITAIVSWEKSKEGSMAFWLHAPDGTILDLHQEMKLFDAYAMATIYLPKEQDGNILPHVGEWQIIVRGETGSATEYHTMVIAEDPETRIWFDYPKKRYEIGDIVPLRIRMEESQQALPLAQEIHLEKTTLRTPVPEVLARYQSIPRQLEERVHTTSQIYELNPLETKMEALSIDPAFKDVLKPQKISSSLREGTLDCYINEREIILPVLLTEPGLNTFLINFEFDSNDTGPISRVSMASVHVLPGEVDPEQSIINMIPVSKERTKGCMIYFTPRNKTGHLLGPGFADELKLFLGKQQTKPNIEDLLDGTYRIEVLEGRDILAKTQPIRLIFKNKTIWTGLIKE
jgi:hypothetical protein